ncbi:MAG: helix-turn-helix domain-containing protein [Aquabacterium sp.]|nr:helix-turn-helix domain-containing protein [Aquabacterium sp.]
MQSDLTTSQQALRRAASLLGGQAALAAALRFKSRRNVWPWFNTGRQVPAEYCPAIERVTAGAVRCEDLRPDIEWGVLRSTKPTEAHQEADRAAA